MPGPIARLATVLLLTALANTASATVYVPGQYRNGVYVRPHFVGVPEQAREPQLALPGEEDQVRRLELMKEEALQQAPASPLPEREISPES